MLRPEVAVELGTGRRGTLNVPLELAGERWGEGCRVDDICAAPDCRVGALRVIDSLEGGVVRKYGDLCGGELRKLAPSAGDLRDVASDGGARARDGSVRLGAAVLFAVRSTSSAERGGCAYPGLRAPDKLVGMGGTSRVATKDDSPRFGAGGVALPNLGVPS